MNKQTILDTATHLAGIYSYKAIIKRHIAQELGCGMGTVNYHWKTMDALRAAVLKQAIAELNVRIVMQAVAFRDPAIYRENGQFIASVRKILDAGK